MRERFVVKFIIAGIVMLSIASCNNNDPGLNNNTGNPNTQPVGIQGEWAIPKDQIVDAGPGKDGIPALEFPENVKANEETYLTDNELVVGFYDGEKAIAYPHQVLDWHEIINDELNGFSYAITYCPLTGTAIGWGRTINGIKTTFGVSGLLYNNNLITYDRRTDSNWSQMRLDCVNGTLIDSKIKTFQLVETRWKTWKEMYPFTKVITLNTGYNRYYNEYPYGDYKTDNDFLLFPISIDDSRLKRKERVHGIIVNGKAKVYRFDSFASTTALINDVVNGEEVIVVGNKNREFIVSFYPQLKDGTTPVFTAMSKGKVILEDDQGNEWDIFGYAVSGPAKGQRLRSTESFIGMWFSWGIFYPNAEIYGK